MNIFLTLKSGHNDAAYFIQQLADHKEVEQVIVFRDTKSLELPKVNYITNYSSVLGKFNFIIRLWQIVVRKHLKPFVIVGIYEVPHGLIAVLAGKLLKRPTIVSIIGNPGYVKLRNGIRMKLTLWILRNVNFITVTGSKSKQFLTEKGFSKEKVFVLPNTLDFNQFTLNRDIKKKYDVISLGRLSEEKKVDQIVRIIGEIKKSKPHIKAAIGGAGPEKENIIRLITYLNLENNIEVLGFIPDDELSNFLSNGKVFLLTSETEGFPRTIIQAAACGAAVVATNVGDISDVIDHNVNGFLVDNYQDIDGFVKYTNILLTDQVKADSFISNLDKKVRSQFANEEATIVWRKILNEISNKKY